MGIVSIFLAVEWFLCLIIGIIPAAPDVFLAVREISVTDSEIFTIRGITFYRRSGLRGSWPKYFHPVTQEPGRQSFHPVDPVQPVGREAFLLESIRLSGKS